MERRQPSSSVGGVGGSRGRGGGAGEPPRDGHVRGGPPESAAAPATREKEHSPQPHKYYPWKVPAGALRVLGVAPPEPLRRLVAPSVAPGDAQNDEGDEAGAGEGISKPKGEPLTRDQLKGMMKDSYGRFLLYHPTGNRLYVDSLAQDEAEKTEQLDDLRRVLMPQGITLHPPAPEFILSAEPSQRKPRPDLSDPSRVWIRALPPTSLKKGNVDVETLYEKIAAELNDIESGQGQKIRWKEIVSGESPYHPYIELESKADATKAKKFLKWVDDVQVQWVNSQSDLTPYPVQGTGKQKPPVTSSTTAITSTSTSSKKTTAVDLESVKEKEHKKPKEMKRVDDMREKGKEKRGKGDAPEKKEKRSKAKKPKGDSSSDSDSSVRSSKRSKAKEKKGDSSSEKLKGDKGDESEKEKLAKAKKKKGDSSSDSDSSVRPSKRSVSACCCKKTCAKACRCNVSKRPCQRHCKCKCWSRGKCDNPAEDQQHKRIRT
ncbi:hypothetical protein Pelo_12159 [Pelomyxa schiedti]|nr:hypothetical protein Pelo_12159 [Pelomyxa schiedti]